MSTDRLREAARVLRQRAEDATPEGHSHPWLYTEATYGDPADGPTHVAVTCCEASGVQSSHFLHTDDGSQETSGTARYMATMHPGLALAFAEWLDEAGADYFAFGDDEHHAPDHEPCDECDSDPRAPHLRHALRVADQILGGAE